MKKLLLLIILLFPSTTFARSTTFVSYPLDLIIYGDLNICARQYKVTNSTVSNPSRQLDGTYTFELDLPNVWSFNSSANQIKTNNILGEWIIKNTAVGTYIQTPPSSLYGAPCPDDPSLVWYNESSILLSPQPTIANANHTSTIISGSGKTIISTN